MALETIAEADKYATTQLMAGVVEEIIAESPLFAFLPFDMAGRRLPRPTLTFKHLRVIES